MIWWLYNFLFGLGFTLMLPRFLWRMVRRGGYARNFSQRFGNYTPEILGKLKDGGRVWVHAVSVGELFVALRFMDELRLRHAGLQFVLTTTTSTGYALAEKKLHADDVLLYFPVDFPFVSRKVVRLIRPRALVLVECELWPNLIRTIKNQGLPVILINGRISDHSFRGYRKVGFFTRRILPLVDVVCVQSRVDGERLIALGADKDKVRLLGTAKYDLTPTDSSSADKAKAVMEAVGFLPGGVVLLGGSTWAGEEAALLDAYKELLSKHINLRLVLVPRHAERTPEVLKEIEARNLKVIRRTQVRPGETYADRPDVLLVDTTGELMGFYATADVVFVGKSLTRHGGQNIIEPAFFSKPVIVGPNMENFPGVMEDFLAGQALIQVQDTSGLRQAVDQLLTDNGTRTDLGAKAAQVVRAKAGAIRKTAELVERAAFPSI